MRVSDLLRAGDVVGIPTDTVYGLAVDAAATGAAGRLFALKRRPRSTPIAVLVAEPGDAALLGDVTAQARDLMERFWPGPLTLVLRRRPEVTFDLGEPETTVGIRCPDHDAVRALARDVGPLATTSANLHGEPTLTTAAALRAAFPGLPVLDGGTCEGLPSTVVDCTTDAPKILRQGRIPHSSVGFDEGAYPPQSPQNGQ